MVVLGVALTVSGLVLVLGAVRAVARVKSAPGQRVTRAIAGAMAACGAAAVWGGLHLIGVY